ncbi:class I SAM-dependent methyltransferase [Pollutimonas thiosulfatoxidans]|uniref:SAM-dependent methyltransferase n=1 Tax=Pollutimonas thiosulfatoxidans TaxID=2028345 RepID=A0A410G971_9BURK|nr:class I SAM-dependent methyltransferase [Pollutimonas thiosulfatoxidans]MBF6615269.1 class I SAM-dependent methyltransferase [Candidimonas sp.]NYT43290.1 class I SAM-dependent methyltransferase [Alcaligenaceae bacterium]QAA92859.1 SAM-dependent methyltransferase [Pollutimonas thiosulfatoxidans]
MSSVLSVVETKLAALPLPVELIMPDGQKVGSADAQIRLTIKDRATLAHLATGQVGVLGEDYVEGKFDISGSMRDLMRLAVAILPGSPIEAARVGRLTELIRRLVSVWRHSIDRDARQIQFHYDLSDDFYALWLDPRRVYSCAYFKTPDMSVAQAQEAKLDHICRKLRLQQGERFLDVGAGWGGLLLWAAEHYGVDATGITLSKNQHAHVNQLIQEKGLQGRVRMELLDYRKLDEAQPYDKIASVGMFEHVGRAQLEGYFSKLRRLLRPGGLIMNHGITAGGVDNAELGAGMGEFIEKYIFPGGELTHISQVLKSMTEGGLEDLDVENLRPHYARTLWAWSDALEACLPEARKTLPGDEGERSLRAYRMYLAGCAMGFEHGWIALHQVLAQPRSNGRSDELDHPADQAYPWRRDYIYS